MPLVVKDRVKETTTTTGTGTLTLAGAVTGFQAFSVIGDGNTTYYTITDGTNFEVGVGTYTLSGTTLSRDTILESSNAGSAVNFSAGSKDVFVTYPAERAVYTDAAGTAITPATASVLGVSSGGTGQTSYINGQLLIGNTTGNTLAKATLTGGTGITVTNGTGSISIAADNNGTVTSVSGTGTVQGLSLSGTVTSSGSLTLGGSLSAVSLTTQVTGDLPFANLAQGSALSVLGVTGNATADVASVAAGTDHQVLRRSGTSVGFGAVNLAQSAAITGTLPVGNGGTGITSFGTGVATFLGTPSSANLAAAVTDETGSGSLVFATSPTLVTPILGTPQSGTVTNLTGTASININGTVGATTPAAGSFTTLNTSGQVVFNDAGANVDFRVEGDTDADLFFVDASADKVGIGTNAPDALLTVDGIASFGAGAAATPSIAAAGDLDTGIFFSAANTVDIATDGVARAQINSAGDFAINAGFGSVGKAYLCRAWVNFKGTGTVSIRASGNVSSITDNGTGDYTVNFTTAMPDADYAVMTGPSIRASSDRNSMPTFYTAGTAATTSSFRIRNGAITTAATIVDAEIFYLSVLR